MTAECPICGSTSHDYFIIFGRMRIFACPEVKDGDFLLTTATESASVAPELYVQILQQPTSLWQTLLKDASCAACAVGVPLKDGRHHEVVAHGGNTQRYEWPCQTGKVG